MTWSRRKDLEGGKELGVWLKKVDNDVAIELYVENHKYRGGEYDVYTATPNGEWDHRGEFEQVEDAFEKAEEIMRS